MNLTDINIIHLNTLNYFDAWASQESVIAGQYYFKLKTNNNIVTNNMISFVSAGLNDQ